MHEQDELEAHACSSWHVFRIAVGAGNTESSQSPTVEKVGHGEQSARAVKEVDVEEGDEGQPGVALPQAPPVKRPARPVQACWSVQVQAVRMQPLSRQVHISTALQQLRPVTRPARPVSQCESMRVQGSAHAASEQTGPHQHSPVWATGKTRQEITSVPASLAD